MPVVPDASVILMWVLSPDHERHVHQARVIRVGYVNGDHEILLPALWLFDVGNTLSRKLPGHAERQMAMLFELELPLISPNVECRSVAFELAARLGVNFYDAAYHGYRTDFRKCIGDCRRPLSA